MESLSLRVGGLTKLAVLENWQVWGPIYLTFCDKLIYSDVFFLFYEKYDIVFDA